ncbi:MAG: cytochrome c-type biogenesis protein CcmH [Magnetococcales bacterium]|nr:cytochrome c-type biogenesis protein CcmH [Magnetococcales bacterium]
MRVIPWLLLFTLMGVTLPTLAAERAEDPNEAQVREIAQGLRCTVCQSQSLYESNSDLAQDMVSVIRDKVAEGQSSEAINKYFFDRYGDYIYMEPVKSGANLVLWLGPFVGLLAGGLGLFVAVRRWQKGQGTQSVAAKSDNQGSVPNKSIEAELDKIEL